MKNKLTTLLIKYTAGEINEKELIESIISVVIECQKTEKYLSDVKFDDKLKGCAIYDFSDKMMAFNLSKMKSDIAEVDEKYRAVLPDYDFLMLQAVEILHITLHELEHVNQAKILDSSDSYETFEGKILLLEDLCLLLTDYNFGDMYYSILPSERLANTKSMKTLKEMFCGQNIESALSKIIYYKYLKKNLTKYQVKNGCVSSPTRNFFGYFEDVGLLKGFPELTGWYYDNPENLLLMNLNARLRYGIDITSDEYSELFEKKMSLKI